MLDGDEIDQMVKRTRHHSIPRWFVKQYGLFKKGFRRGSVKPIPDNLHRAYHTVFGGKCPWAAVRVLKKWSKEIKRNKQPYFYDKFTPKQKIAFNVLFEFEPKELGNGLLFRAIRFIQDSGFFYPDKKSMEDLERIINKQ